MNKLRMGSAVVLIVAFSLVAAVAAFGGSAATTTVTVTAGKPGEFNFTLSKKTIAKGTAVFKVTNKGAIKHDFKIAGKRTPSLATGKTSTLKVVFTKAGKYPYLCTLPGHAPAGMKGTLIVK